LELQVKNNKGEVVGALQASDSVWNAVRNDAVLHQAVTTQRANKRQGTHDTLARIDVQYSTRKLRAQKHTGRARLGSRGSPSMGGSVAHGPHPRDYREKLPKKMRLLALRTALSDKVRESGLTVLDALSLDAPKTSVVRDLVTGLGLKGTTLIITPATDHNVVRSAANIPGVHVLAARLLNPLQAVTARNLVITQDAVRVVDSLWGGKGAAT
jgi:large subunit ribosomal protein L4